MTSYRSHTGSRRPSRARGLLSRALAIVATVAMLSAGPFGAASASAQPARCDVWPLVTPSPVAACPGD